MKKIVLAISLCILASAFIFAGCNSDSADRGKVSDTTQGITTTKTATTDALTTAVSVTESTAPVTNGTTDITGDSAGETTSVDKTGTTDDNNLID